VTGRDEASFITAAFADVFGAYTGPRPVPALMDAPDVPETVWADEARDRQRAHDDWHADTWGYAC
jgi:hypothetical protein